MEDKKFDSLITETLQELTGDLHAPTCLKEQIHQRMDSQNKEVSVMKHFKWKKIIIVAAAICTLGTVAAMAAGRVTILVSSSNNQDNQFPAFQDLIKAEEQLGYPVNAVDRFDNGFEYKQGNIRTVEGMDESGNKLTSYEQLSIDYRNSEDQLLMLNVYRPSELVEKDGRAPQVKQDINGTEVSYFRDRYKFLPPDMEPSEEDLKAQDAGELFISYGSSEVQETYACYAVWIQDDITYSLMTMEKDMSADEMMSMAQAVIK